MSEQIVASGFDGVIVIASNPVDVLTNALQKFKGFPRHRIVGSGTTLDTSRFCYIWGDRLNLAPSSVRGYIIGEHGDTQLAAWSNVFVYGKNSINSEKLLTQQEDLQMLKKSYALHTKLSTVNVLLTMQRSCIIHNR